MAPLCERQELLLGNTALTGEEFKNTFDAVATPQKAKDLGFKR
jgi:hypothetical protein